MPHQERVLEWARDRSSLPAFMQMRLGKSLVAIRWVEAKPDVDKALVVCPLSVVPSWERELRLEGIEPCLLVGTAAQRTAAAERAGRDHKWYVINNEGLTSGRLGAKRKPSEFAQLPWDAVIIDESPSIRNPKAKLTQVALSYLAQAKYRAPLSGLPNPEGPEDYVTQMLFAMGGEFMGCRSFWEWRQKHMTPAGFGWTVKASSLGLLRAEVHKRSVIMTRAQAGIPDRKLRSVRHVAPPRRVMDAIRQARTEFAVGDLMTSNALVAQQWQCRLAGGRFPGFEHDAKLDELVYLARGEFRKERVVVWARYTAELEAASERLTAAGVPNAVVRGEVPQAERQRRIAAFKAGKLRALVAQPRCLDRGVDLSEANVAVILSNYFDFEIRAQLEDRIVHPKKSEPCLIVDIVARGTVDEDIADALADKRSTASSFNAKLLRLAGKKGGRN